MVWLLSDLLLAIVGFVVWWFWRLCGFGHSAFVLDLGL